MDYFQGLVRHIVTHPPNVRSIPHVHVILSRPGHTQTKPNPRIHIPFFNDPPPPKRGHTKPGKRPNHGKRQNSKPVFRGNSPSHPQPQPIRQIPTYSVQAPPFNPSPTAYSEYKTVGSSGSSSSFGSSSSSGSSGSSVSSGNSANSVNSVSLGSSGRSYSNNYQQKDQTSGSGKPSEISLGSGGGFSPPEPHEIVSITDIETSGPATPDAGFRYQVLDPVSKTEGSTTSSLSLGNNFVKLENGPVSSSTVSSPASSSVPNYSPAAPEFSSAPDLNSNKITLSTYELEQIYPVEQNDLKEQNDVEEQNYPTEQTFKKEQKNHKEQNYYKEQINHKEQNYYKKQTDRKEQNFYKEQNYPKELNYPEDLNYEDLYHDEPASREELEIILPETTVAQDPLADPTPGYNKYPFFTQTDNILLGGVPEPERAELETLSREEFNDSLNRLLDYDTSFVADGYEQILDEKIAEIQRQAEKLEQRFWGAKENDFSI